MTFEETVTDMSQLADIAYLPYGASINIGDVYYQNVTLSDANGNLKSYYLTSKYTVIDYDNNSKGNGMEAVLLRNDTTGQFVISFRGTQEPIDGIYDVTTGVLNYNPQIPDATAFVQKALDNPDYNISSSNLTLTGHSLGGILTQAVGADLKIQGYTFNAWSSSNLIDYSNYLLDPLGLIHRVASLLGWGAEATAFAERNILNLSYTDSGMFNGDPLSNVLSGILGLNEFLGTVMPIFGADLSLIDGHRMPNMITAINHYNILLNHFDNKDFLVLTMAYVLSDLTGRNQFYEKGESYFNAVGVYDTPANSLTFNFLDDLSAFQIEQQAKSDRAVLFALIKLNGFAVEGSLGSYSSLDLADYSSHYIEDRSLLLYHMLDPNNRNLGDLHIKDRGYGVEVGSDGWIWDNPNILFGYDGVNQSYIEELIGGSKADHLFGMGGDDLLIGDAGDDYLEGGKGLDTLIGGSDYDTYIAGDMDAIYDTDGQGEVVFEGMKLTGGTLISSSGGVRTYEGDGGIYTLTNDTLYFAKKGNFITINQFNKANNDLGITLTEEPPEFTIIGYTANENDGVVTGKVILTQAYSEDIVVHLSTLDDSAHAGEDYIGKNSMPLTIKAGTLEKEFSVTLVDDKRAEGRETFFVQIDSVNDTTGQELTYTIKDITPLTIEDDDILNLSVFAPVVGETTGATTGAVTLSHAYHKDLTITLYTQDNSATAGEDYQANPAITVHIAAGSTLDEGNAMMRYDITLTSGPVDKDITIELQTINGSATSGSDYMGSQGFVTIKAGETSAYYNVMILNKNERMAA